LVKKINYPLIRDKNSLSKTYQNLIEELEQIFTAKTQK